jgi:amino acid transporter
MAMATSAEAPQAAPAARLSANELGTKDLVFFVVAAAAPLTIVAGVMPLAIRAGGKAAAYGYIVPGIVLLLFSCGFTAMSPLIKNAGAFYSYIARGLGRPFGVGSALIALVSYNAMTITLMAGFAYFTKNMFASLFHLNVPWQILAVAGILAVGLFGYFKVTLSARVLGIALGLELLVVTIYDLIVVAKDGAHGLTAGTFAPSVLHGAGFGALIVLTAGSFIGFEATALYAEEARNPARTVPRATYIAIGFLAIFYTFTIWCIYVAFGPDKAVAVAQGNNVSSLAFLTIGQYVGTWASDAAQVLLCSSAFAAALAFHNAASRYFFSLGRERVLPQLFGRVSARFGTPVAGVIAQTVVTVIILAVAVITRADPYLVVFLWASAPGVLGILALEALASVSVVAFFFGRRRAGHSLWRVLVAPALAAVGLAALVVLSVMQISLLTGASSTVNLALLLPIPVVFVVGIGVALWLRRRSPAAYQNLGSGVPEPAV